MNPSAAKTPLERLELLYHLTQAFNSTLDLNEVLDRVIDEVIVVTGAERGFVMLRNENGGLDFKIARGLDQTTISEPKFQVSRSIMERVADEGEAVLTSDAQMDERFSARQSVVILGLRSIICVPLLIKDRTLGVIYVDNRMQAGIFTPSDLDLLKAIASSAAIAIENARLYEVAVVKARLERELQVARQVQISMLPADVPQFKGWEFAGRWLPAREVAGDYYDFFPLNSSNASPHLGIVLADVTDKGMPAALFMAVTRSTVRASMDEAHSAADGIRHANHLICEDSSHSMFVTLFFARLDPWLGRLVYVNAGHNPPFYYQAATKSLSLLSRTGMALGVSEQAGYTEDAIDLAPGDFICMYTDGITDAINPQGQEFGMSGIGQALLANSSGSADDLIRAVEFALQEFCGESQPFDDVTMVMLKRDSD